ncbi:hypothetical protein PUN28_020342 [Cardiocondyla obscurior]|uniref:Uncharacterized protein n=1 Tax=Cardiocondyla obscurior TaxID=286306 RepID=A0AAW2E9D8_9HYME
MAKKRKKKFSREFYNVPIQAASIFWLRYIKQKNILKFYNVSIGQQLKKKCIQRVYSDFPIIFHQPSFIFIRSRDMAKKQKNVAGEILQRSIYIVAFKINALGPIRNLYFHQKPRYGQKTKKKYFEILHNHCASFKIKMHSGLIFLYFPITLCSIQNRCIRAYSDLLFSSRSRDMAKKRKKYFEGTT